MYIDVGNVKNVICEASIGINDVYTGVENLGTVISEAHIGTKGGHTRV